MATISIEKKRLQKMSHLEFSLPDDLQCAKPTEVRGIRRDEVKLMVSHFGTDQVEHGTFKNLDRFLSEGDVLVVNTSGTMKAALEAFRHDGKRLRVHFSTQVDDGRWAVEIRAVIDGKTRRFGELEKGETLAFKNGGSLTLEEPYYRLDQTKHLKIWLVRLNINIPLNEYLDHYGMPIRYNYVKDSYPQSYYQTIFARDMGSAEMPSAGRAFTPDLVARLVPKGVQLVPILLHTGVASLEVNEQPYEEFFRVSKFTADSVNLAKQNGGRVIAIGTTVVRALESALNKNGKVKASEGRTNLFITPQRGLFAVDALLTGFHEPKASHLYMLEALAGQSHLGVAYEAALSKKYQWHEFGDLHLILP